MESWKKLSQSQQKVGYKTVVFKEFLLPDDERAEYTTWGHTGSNNAATIALTIDNRIVVAQQFRPGPEKIFYELPGGGVEEGEDPVDSAARELLEETGYATDEPFVYLGPTWRDAYTNETSHYYFARNCYVKTREQRLDNGEFVKLVLIDINELIENAKKGRMSDGIGVLMAYDMLRAIQEE
jgi:ADP-ribose pyrophosphatase